MREIDIPRTPTTDELLERHPLSIETELSIANERSAVDTALKNHEESLLAVIGYCARPNVSEQHTILEEGRAIASLEAMGPNMQAAHRGPWHKPRTNPILDWQGEEQTDPEGVHASIHGEAVQVGQVTGEVRCEEHLLRYAHMLKWAWTGGRNEEETH